MVITSIIAANYLLVGHWLLRFFPLFFCRCRSMMETKGKIPHQSKRKAKQNEEKLSRWNRNSSPSCWRDASIQTSNVSTMDTTNGKNAIVHARRMGMVCIVRAWLPMKIMWQSGNEKINKFCFCSVAKWEQHHRLYIMVFAGSNTNHKTSRLTKPFIFSGKMNW